MPRYAGAVAVLTGGVAAAEVGGLVASATVRIPSAGSGLLTAAGVAQRVANQVGGKIRELNQSEGFRVTVSAARDIVARIKSSGAVRVSIDGIGSLTKEGCIVRPSADSLAGLSSQQIVRLVQGSRVS